MFGKKNMLMKFALLTTALLVSAAASAQKIVRIEKEPGLSNNNYTITTAEGSETIKVKHDEAGPWLVRKLESYYAQGYRIESTESLPMVGANITSFYVNYTLVQPAKN